MSREQMHTGVEWRGYGGSEIQLSRSHRQRGAKVGRGRTKTDCGKWFHSHLIVGVKEDAAACANYRFPARIIVSSPRQSQARSKVIPASIPQRCTAGSKCQRTGVANASEERIGILAVGSVRRWIGLPTQAEREVQPWREVPLILEENCCFIENWRRTYRVQYSQRKGFVTQNLLRTEVSTDNLRTYRIVGRDDSAIIRSNLEVMTPKRNAERIDEVPLAESIVGDSAA